MPRRPPMPLVMLPLLASFFGGCTTLAPTSSSSNDRDLTAPQSEAERVFLYQSRLADAVLDRMALRELNEAGASDPVLAAADTRMGEVCRYLSEAAVSRAEGRRLRWDLRLEVFATTTSCAQAAREVELLLRGNAESLATAKL